MSFLIVLSLDIVPSINNHSLRTFKVFDIVEKNKQDGVAFFAFIDFYQL